MAKTTKTTKKTKTTKHTANKTNTSKSKQSSRVLVAMTADAEAIKSWKKHLHEKRASIQQAGRIAKIQAILTVLNRSKEGLQLCSAAEAEAVKTGLHHYLFMKAGQPRIQYYLLAAWKKLADKQIAKILERKNGTELELRSSAEFDKILADIDLRISRGENARAFVSQKERVEASYALFKPLEALYNEMDGAIADCRTAEANESDTAEADSAETSKPAKSKRGRKVKADEAEAPKPEPVMPVAAGASAAAAAAEVRVSAPAPVEEVEEAENPTDEELEAQEAAMADMDDEDDFDVAAALGAEDVDADPFQPEDADIEVMSNDQMVATMDGDDDEMGSGEYESDDEWDRDEDEEEEDEDEDYRNREDYGDYGKPEDDGGYDPFG